MQGIECLEGRVDDLDKNVFLFFILNMMICLGMHVIVGYSSLMEFFPFYYLAMWNLWVLTCLYCKILTFSLFILVSMTLNHLTSGLFVCPS